MEAVANRINAEVGTPGEPIELGRVDSNHQLPG